jgi:hypothetical protein
MSPRNGQQEIPKPEPNGTGAPNRNTSHPASSPGHHAARKVPPGLLETLALIALLTAYGVFLILGTFVQTIGLDKKFADGSFRAGEVFVMLTCWTWTNILILCCLASVIGELGRRVLLGAREVRSVRGAIVRAFFVFLVIMAAQFIILGTPGATPLGRELVENKVAATHHSEVEDLYTHVCLQHFFRLAAFASLLAFMVAMHPGLVRRILERLEGELQEASPEVQRIAQLVSVARLGPVPPPAGAHAPGNAEAPPGRPTAVGGDRTRE